MDCFGTCFTHVQTCDSVRVPSATEWTASVHTLHMPKPVITFVFQVLRNGLLRYILYTCPNLWWRSCSKCCYGINCFGSYVTHVQTCDNVRVPSATEWTASVHAVHMSKPVVTFVFQVLRNGLLCASEWQRCTRKCADSAKSDVMRKHRCCLPCYWELQKNSVLPQRELRFVFPEPWKNVTDFAGLYKIEFTCQSSGKTVIFCNSQ